MSFEKHLIHALANCQHCDFEDHYYQTAQKTGKEHFQKTGHHVIIELGYHTEYSKKAP